jgi:hypothetical protein
MTFGMEPCIPSLFSSTVRDVDDVVDTIEDGKLGYSFADSNSAGLILNSWLAAWQESQGDTYDSTAYGNCPSTDKQLIGFLAGYIKNNSTLSLCIPQLSWTNSREKGTSKYVYSSSGYGSIPAFSPAPTSASTSTRIRTCRCTWVRGRCRTG